MEHKVQIQNIYDKTKEKDPILRSVRNNFQQVVTKIDQFTDFINTACIYCTDSDDTIIKRSLFETRINEINETLKNALKNANEFGDTFINLSDFWCESITDTTGLDNPVCQQTEIEEPPVLPDTEINIEGVE